MSPANLRVLQSEQSSGNIPGLAEQKDHFGHISPLSMVGDRKVIRRRRSWRDALRTLTSPTAERPPALRAGRLASAGVSSVVKRTKSGQSAATPLLLARQLSSNAVEAGALADEEDAGDLIEVREEDRPLEARVRFNPTVVQTEAGKPYQETDASEHSASQSVPLGTRLTMTSRTGYFQDRIISPSMVRGCCS